MLFWIISGLLALITAGFVARPMLRARADSGDSAEAPDVAIYRAQLDEIGRDTARGVLDPGEAERARAEVARRLIAADAAATTLATGPRGTTLVVATAAVALIALLAVGVYMRIGAPGEPDRPLTQRLAQADAMRQARPDQAALAAAAPPQPPVDAPQDYRDTVAQLREIMPDRPEDLRGWSLLAFHEAELRNFSAAWTAQERVIALKGADATMADRQLQLDLMVAATNGMISPEAEMLARDILDRDATNIAAHYYLGALFDQTDRPDIAYQSWRPIAEAPGDSFHHALARAQIENAAARAGIEYTLPGRPGPDAAALAMAEDMTEGERAELIVGMVDRLARRLATEGGPAADWARLIAAFGVLGDQDAAREIWVEASQAFAANETAMAALRAAADSAGVLE